MVPFLVPNVVYFLLPDRLFFDEAIQVGVLESLCTIRLFQGRSYCQELVSLVGLGCDGVRWHAQVGGVCLVPLREMAWAR